MLFRSSVPVHGGVLLDMTALDGIVEVDHDSMLVRVLPGTFGTWFEETLRAEHGVTAGHWPQSIDLSTVGGWIACRGAGQYSTRYGKIEDIVAGLEVVLADGRIIRTGGAPRAAVGPDLTQLFVGSEGTLGIITEITVRLYGIPAATSSAMCSFPSVKDAVDTVIQTIQSGIPVARIELADAVQMDAINKYSKLNQPVAPTLWLEFHGTEASVAEQAEMVQALAAEHGGANFSWTTSPEERKKLWQARHDAAWANKALRVGAQVWATDVCVPISRLAECIVETQKDIEQSFLPAPIVGHVGDGNFHLTLVLKPEDPKEVAEAERLNDRLVKRALAMEGTCTGEHGVGYGKLDFLIAEHGEAVSVMRSIKHALDPDNIFNPGKIIRV